MAAQERTQGAIPRGRPRRLVLARGGARKNPVGAARFHRSADRRARRLSVALAAKMRHTLVQAYARPVWSTPMSDCLHCDINDLVQTYIEQNQTVDVAEVAAKIAESLADLILSSAESDQPKLLAHAMAALGDMYLQKSGAVDG